LDEVHNHHNYAWLETHDIGDGKEEKFWVVRKGCTPAFSGQRGFVGATMGEEAVILEGTQASEEALSSTVHGAGRAMSRSKAAGKIRRRKTWECADRNCDRTFDIDGVSSHNAAPKKGICPDHPEARVRKVWRTEVKSKGLIDFEQVKRDMDQKGIVLRGGAADEAPGAYKRLDEVLTAHGDTVRILHRLTPIGVAMAGSEVRDDYKD
jgi:tRNA-splicing ligase RtcB